MWKCAKLWLLHQESTELFDAQKVLYVTSSLFYHLNQAHPAENDPKDPAQPNRFNAVIEKIERLYMVVNSSIWYQVHDA